MKKFCYWSVADGEHGYMAETMIKSARDVGVTEDFYMISDRHLEGSTLTYECGDFKKDHYLFKFDFLKEHMQKLLTYEYFVFIDADCFFVRNPGDLSKYLHEAPIHVCLESDCTLPSLREDWWGCPLPIYVELMRQRGVKSKAVYNTNAGFWIVKRTAVNHFCDLAFNFWHHCKNKGFTFTEEAPLAYAGHMLTGDCELHTIRATSELWASDWMGVYKERLPDGNPWNFTDYMTMVEYQVNPAIVHAMRSKQTMIDTTKAK